MDENLGEGAPSTSTTTTETVSLTKEQFAELERKANVSSQNFERLKKLEEENKLLTEKQGQSIDIKAIDEKVDLRIEGYNHEEIAEIAAYAKVKGIGLLEAKEAPIIKAGIQALRAAKASTDNTPSPSNRGIPLINGKTYDQIINDPEASNADKQAALDARYAKGGVRNQFQ